MNSYDGSRLDALATSLWELCKYAAVEEWNARAKEEANVIDGALTEVIEAMKSSAEQVQSLSQELDRAKFQFGSQSLLKRLFSSHTVEKEIWDQIYSIDQHAITLQVQRTELLQKSSALTDLIRFAAE